MPSMGPARRRDDRAFHTRFRCGSSACRTLTFPTDNSELADSFCKKHAVTRSGDRSLESRRQTTRRRLVSRFWSLVSGVGLRPFVSMWFQIYFTALTGLLFTFPSRYLFAIGEQTYFALRVLIPSPRGARYEVGCSARRFQQDFSGPAVLRMWTAPVNEPSHTGLLPSLVMRSSLLLLGSCLSTPGSVQTPRPCPSTPLVQRCTPWHTRGLGSSPFARHYSGNESRTQNPEPGCRNACRVRSPVSCFWLLEHCFLFLGLLRCFSSPSFTSHKPCSLWITRHDSRRVTPFGDLRITGCSAPPRSVSPLAASFVVVCSQGIHHTLFWRLFSCGLQYMIPHRH